ncbi:phenazine biosynthesis protein PhzF family [Streptococcus troglodytae]|uniref:Phenazine biosynthesis protein PhzF family n=1 Tax=Streptococcus troglodytae TaxID=1111760 RepID=A0A1L7LJT6_9STRE|nr:phenazine biosynthesis protein PhzF family [Streptococcus troglodytae]
MIDPQAQEVTFDTLSGPLKVLKKGDLYELTFPSYKLLKTPVTKAMTEAFGTQPSAAYLGRDLVCIFDHEDTVRNYQPKQEQLAQLPGLLQHMTSQGEAYDCLSRSFAPKLLIKEDPVCGSGHCHIVPYWAKQLGKKDILAFQASERTGILHCQYQGEQTKLAGQAVLFSQGEIFF